MIPQVLTPDEWLSALPKPPLQDVESIVATEADVLLVCAGFEDRSVASLASAVKSGRRFTVLLVKYLPHMSENRAAEILALCNHHELRVQEVIYDRENPAGIGTEILRKLTPCDGRVLIDVSAMSRLLVVQVLVALATRPMGFANCTIVYSEASAYPPTREEAEAKLQRSDVDPTFAALFLSSGVFDIAVVPELSSVAPPDTQHRLIAFPSFDAHQLTAVRAEIHPSVFEFVEGDPPNAHNKWRRELIARLNRLEEIPNSARSAVSTLDYAATLEFLLKCYKSRSNRERLLICPTGSKMQTVAVGIFRAFLNDVQIVYPTPQDFVAPGSYTIGIGPLHVLDLDSFRES